MYYEERMIGLVMCYRSRPDGEWMPMDVATLSKKLVEQQAKCEELREFVLSVARIDYHGTPSEMAEDARKLFLSTENGDDK